MKTIVKQRLLRRRQIYCDQERRARLPYHTMRANSNQVFSKGQSTIKERMVSATYWKAKRTNKHQQTSSLFVWWKSHLGGKMQLKYENSNSEKDQKSKKTIIKCMFRSHHSMKLTIQYFFIDVRYEVYEMTKRALISNEKVYMLLKF